jgi:N-acyl-D-amino-acid deacylase
LHNYRSLQVSYAADIVLFDEKQVKDLSTFEQPHQYSTGFIFILVNGVLTLENRKHLGVRGGMVLTGNNEKY